MPTPARIKVNLKTPKKSVPTPVAPTGDTTEDPEPPITSDDPEDETNPLKSAPHSESIKD